MTEKYLKSIVKMEWRVQDRGYNYISFSNSFIKRISKITSLFVGGTDVGSVGFQGEGKYYAFYYGDGFDFNFFSKSEYAKQWVEKKFIKHFKRYFK